MFIRYLRKLIYDLNKKMERQREKVKFKKRVQKIEKLKLKKKKN